MKKFVETLFGIVFFFTVVIFVPFAAMYTIISLVEKYFK